MKTQSIQTTKKETRPINQSEQYRKIKKRSYNENQSVNFNSRDSGDHVFSGVDASINLLLEWVGPGAPPKGQANITVTLGAVALVEINGELEDTATSSAVACFGVDATNPSVCSGHGQCISQDLCTFETGYLGADCGILTCNGVGANESIVCSGHGTCVDVDVCQCDGVFYGADCESRTPCATGYYLVGNICEELRCFGVSSLDPTVCSRAWCLYKPRCM